MKHKYKLNRKRFRHFICFCLSCTLTLTGLIAGAREIGKRAKLAAEEKERIERALPKLSTRDEDLLAKYITCTKSNTSEAEEIVREVFSGVSMEDAISKRSETFGEPDAMGYFTVSAAEKNVREEFRREMSGK